MTVNMAVKKKNSKKTGEQSETEEPEAGGIGESEIPGTEGTIEEADVERSLTREELESLRRRLQEKFH
jgi:hypothetical protein